MHEKLKDDLTLDLNHDIYTKIKRDMEMTKKYDFLNNHMICVYNTKINDEINVVHYGYNPFYKYDNLCIGNNIFENNCKIGNEYVKGIISGNNNISQKEINKLVRLCYKQLITPNMSFLLTFISIKHDNPHKSELLSMLNSKYSDWTKTKDSDKINWIKQLMFSDTKDKLENMIDFTILNFFEIFHYYLNYFRPDNKKIVFVRGMYSLCNPFVAFDDGIITKYYVTNNDIRSFINLTYGCNHSQLYIFSKNKKYIYDSDEMEKNELLTRKHKMKEFNILNINPIQKITNDTNCLFHTIRMMIEVIKYNINFNNNDNIKKLNDILFFKTKGKTELINKMNRWINSNAIF